MGGEPGAVVASRFVLCDPVGAGGMSTVWRARDLRTGELVAVKVLAASYAGALHRFVAEQSLRMSHPHLVTPYCWAADDQVAVLAMPLVRGGSVERLRRRHGRLPEPFVRVLLDQLLAALEVVHRAGVVHRDVKPANLLLEATGRGYPQLRLADFGVAAHPHHPRLTGESAVVGTDGYMAVAQARGAEPDPGWDLYAAAVVARELLTGSRTGEVPGALGALLTAMAVGTTGATAARARLAELGVPTRAAWPGRPGGPVLGDVLGPDPRGRPPVDAGRWQPRLGWLAVGLSLLAVAVSLAR